MAQSVNLWGATYSDVPAIEVPKSGGGMASFTDVTDTTAAASDVATGKYFYTAAGVRTQGTGSGGGSGGNVWQDAQGYVHLDDEGTGGGGSGLEYETGTWTSSEETNHPTIQFTKTHSEPPIIIRIADVGSAFTPSVNALIYWSYFDSYKLTGGTTPASSTKVGYVIVEQSYISTSGSLGGGRSILEHSSEEPQGTGVTYPAFYATESAIKPYTLGSRYYIVGRTYKWIAVWAPTT